MRIAVSSLEDQGLESTVSGHFGRCSHFILVDVENGEVRAIESVENPFYGQHQPGQIPDFIHHQGADVMISGGMGRRAVDHFNQFGIKAVTGAMGTVAQALELYLNGELQGAAPCRESEEHRHDH